MALLSLPGTPAKVLRELPAHAPYPLATTNTNAAKSPLKLQPLVLVHQFIYLSLELNVGKVDDQAVCVSWNLVTLKSL